jgi:PKD repeat protein
MLKNIAAGLVALVLLLLGAGSAFAQTQTADDYGNGTVSSGVYCPQISQTMQKGARDTTTNPQGQVSELQAFLTDYYNLNDGSLVGGYFGKLTQKYVIQFQTEQNLPSFGIAGSLTRAKISSLCGTNTSAGNASTHPTNTGTVQATTSSPVITSTSAKAANAFEADAGGELAIMGQHFMSNNGQLSGQVNVWFQGVQNRAEVISLTDTQAVVRVPHELVPGNSYTMYLVSGNGTSNTVSVKILSTLSNSTSPTVTATPTSISSGQSVKYLFTFPKNTIGAKLSISCNSGLDTGSTNQCGSSINVLSNSDYTLPFYNNSQSAQQVTSLYCITTSDNQYHPCVNGPTITVAATSATANPITFGASPTTGAAPLSVQFYISGLNQGQSSGPYTVNFGDGSASYYTNTVGKDSTTHTYTSAGTYSVALSHIIQCGDIKCPQTIGTSTIVVTSAQTSSINFIATPTTGTLPLAVTFSASGLPSNGSYSVNFGDGSTEQLTVIACTNSYLNPSCSYGVSHTYSAPGTYTAKIYNNLADCSKNTCALASTIITVLPIKQIDPQPVSVSFTATPTTGAAPLSVQYFMSGLNQGQSSGPYTLNFGDGSATYSTNTVGRDNTTHTYTAAGPYTATLSQNVQCGTTNSMPGNPIYCPQTITSVTITAAPRQIDPLPVSVSFTASPTTGSAPLTTTFNTTLPGNGSFGLDFGDGSSGVAFSASQCSSTYVAACVPGPVSHTYANAGTYTATLTNAQSHAVLSVVVVQVASSNTKCISKSDLSCAVQGQTGL